MTMEITVHITLADDLGNITQTLTADPLNAEANKVGLWAYGLGDPKSQYINKETKTLVNKLSQNTSYNQGLLSDLPNPCTIDINGSLYPCESNQVELELEPNHTYKIRVIAFPYLDWETTIEN